MDFGAGARKRGRADGVPNGNGVSFGGKRQKETETFQSGLGSKSKPCTKFFSTAGCPFGEGCHFMHFVPGGIKAVAPTVGLGNMAVHAPSRNLVVAPPPVSDAPSPKVKSKMCNKYNTAEGCKFGDKCHFAHGEWELGRPALSPHGHDDRALGGIPMMGGRLGGGRLDQLPHPMAGQGAAASFGASATAKISVDGSLAGAIIGKGGANTKHICRVTGAKLSIREHDSDPNLRNIELEGAFEQIGQASSMVKELIVNLSSSAPLPPPAKAPPGLALAPSGMGGKLKTKLCENFTKGTCTFADRCHFAHGSNELRKSAV